MNTLLYAVVISDFFNEWSLQPPHSSFSLPKGDQMSSHLFYDTCEWLAWKVCSRAKYPSYLISSTAFPPLLPKLRNRLKFAIGNQQDLKQNGNSVPKQREFYLSILVTGVLLAKYGTQWCESWWCKSWYLSSFISKPVIWSQNSSLQTTSSFGLPMVLQNWKVEKRGKTRKTKLPFLSLSELWGFPIPFLFPEAWSEVAGKTNTTQMFRNKHI